MSRYVKRFKISTVDENFPNQNIEFDLYINEYSFQPMAEIIINNTKTDYFFNMDIWINDNLTIHQWEDEFLGIIQGLTKEFYNE